MAAPPWRSEQAVTPDQAISLIENQFEALAPLTLQPLGAGWDNTVFLVNQKWVFRFPRRQMALNLMATEWKLLACLAPSLQLTIPVPHFQGQPTTAFPWPFAGYTVVPGTTACGMALTAKQRQAIAPVLGQFLQQLHAWPIEQAHRLNMPLDTMGKVDLAARLPQTYERLEQAVQAGLLPDSQPWIKGLALLPRSTPQGRPCCLVHGDLYVRHLVVDAEAQLHGVIDWGDAHVGDPATDLSVAYSFLPPQAHPDFWAAYGEVDATTQQLAHFRALFHTLALLLYAHDIHDHHLKREAQLALEWLRDFRL